MRKSFFIFCVATSAGVASYSAYWFHQADVARTRTVELVTKFNAYESHVDAGVAPLRYESIYTGGFPFAPTVALKRPVFTIPVSALLQRAQTSKNIGHIKQPIEWTEIISADEITIAQRGLNGELSFHLSGPVTDQSYIDHKLRSTTLSTSDELTCNVKAPANFIDRLTASEQTLPLGNIDWATTDGSIGCMAKRLDIRDQTSNAIAYKADETSFSISNAASKNANRSIRFQSHVANSQYFPAGDAIFQQVFKGVASEVDRLKPNYTNFIKPSEFGIGNQDVDVAYDGPVSANAFRVNPLLAKLDINKFDVKNDLLTYNLTAHAETGESHVNSYRLSLHQRTTVSERYDDVSQQAVAKSFRAFVPNLHSLGAIKLDIDVSGDADTSIKSDANEYSVNIANAAINTDPYGLTLSGKYWHDKQQQNTDLTLSIRNFDKLMNDARDYTARAESAVAPKLPVQVTEGTVESARRLIHTITDTSNRPNGTLTIHVQQQPGQPPTVNGKGILEIMSLMQGSSTYPM